ncbi:MAG: MFS transporter [Candidatus Wildermuthbacteria bacterium]|nr:MFS transporter [Candidatus Wildermuthbacteria bacterium]
MKTIKFTFRISLNKVVRFLITSDLSLSMGWGFIAPIFAVFVTEQIADGDLRVVGFSAGLYWITKSIAQPFIARHVDKNHGEIDDFYFLVWGLFLSGLVPLGYLFINSAWQLYALEFIHGIAMACAVPTWAGIFTRHIDKGQEAFDWSIESTALGFGAGVAGALGGWMASTFGFSAVFIFVSAFTMFAVILLFPIRPLIIPKVRQPVRPETKKPPFSEEKGAF